MGRKKSPRRNNQSNRARGYNGHRQHQDRYGKGAFTAGEQLAQRQNKQQKKKARWRGGTARPEEVAKIALEVFGGQYYCVGTGNEEVPWEQTQAV